MVGSLFAANLRCAAFLPAAFFISKVLINSGLN